MIKNENIDPFANIDASKIAGAFGAIKTYYVSRNSGGGDGSNWLNAFKTIGEAIAAVNADYTKQTSPGKGRDRRIVIGEGWYGEKPLILTANDVHMVSVAPGHHDSTVLYGSATAGGFDIGAGGPALSVRGSNNTIEGLGFFTHDVLYPALRIGANASDPDSPVAIAPTGNKIINCSSIRDVADGCIGGILDYGADGTLIKGCFFSTSNKDYGIKVISNGVVNPVNPRIIECDFVGTPIGIIIGATAHDTLIKDCMFRDDSSDRADTITTPITNAGTASSTVCIGNYWAFSDANAVTGNAAMMIDNHQLAST